MQNKSNLSFGARLILVLVQSLAPRCFDAIISLSRHFCVLYLYAPFKTQMDTLILFPFTRSLRFTFRSLKFKLLVPMMWNGLDCYRDIFSGITLKPLVTEKFIEHECSRTAIFSVKGCRNDWSNIEKMICTKIDWIESCRLRLCWSNSRRELQKNMSHKIDKITKILKFWT